MTKAERIVRLFCNYLIDNKVRINNPDADVCDDIHMGSEWLSDVLKGSNIKQDSLTVCDLAPLAAFKGAVFRNNDPSTGLLYGNIYRLELIASCGDVSIELFDSPTALKDDPYFALQAIRLLSEALSDEAHSAEEIARQLRKYDRDVKKRYDGQPADLYFSLPVGPIDAEFYLNLPEDDEYYWLNVLVGYMTDDVGENASELPEPMQKVVNELEEAGFAIDESSPEISKNRKGVCTYLVDASMPISAAWDEDALIDTLEDLFRRWGEFAQKNN